MAVNQLLRQFSSRKRVNETNMFLTLSHANGIIQKQRLTQLMTSLVELTNTPLAPEELEQLANSLTPLAEFLDGSKGVLCVTAANLLSRQMKQGSYPLTPHISHSLVSLLSASAAFWDSMHAVYIARATRAMTVSSFTDLEQNLLRSLMDECRRPARLESFSAMDLTEIIHAVTLISLDQSTNSSWFTHAFVCDFIKLLATEFIERAPYMHMRIKRDSSADRQWISIQAISNILFSLSRATDSSEAYDWKGIQAKLVDICNDLICHHSEKDALKSCQPKHVLSIIRSQIRLKPTTSSIEVKAMRLLLSELVRKNGAMEGRERDELDELLLTLEGRWRIHDYETRSIPSIVRHRFIR